MNGDNPAQILVIILAVLLTLFLFVGIILLIILVRITRKIKNITTTADQTVSQLAGSFGKIAVLGSSTIAPFALKTIFKIGRKIITKRLARHRPKITHYD